MNFERVVLMVTEQGVSKTVTAFKNLANQMDNSSKSAKGLNASLAALGGYVSIRAIVMLADEYVNLKNKLRIVTNSADELNDKFSELLSIANRTRQSHEASVKTYSRMALAMRGTGRSAQEVTQFVELVNKQLAITGVSTYESAHGLVQLSQAMSMGVLRGQDLRSVLELLPGVAKVIADRMGLTNAALRELASQGRVTADEIMAAFSAARDQIEKDFLSLEVTPMQSLVILANQVRYLGGKFLEETGAIRLFTSAIGFLADNMRSLAPLIVGLGVASLSATLLTIVPRILAITKAVEALRAAMIALQAASGWLGLIGLLAGLGTAAVLSSDTVISTTDKATRTFGDYWKTALDLSITQWKDWAKEVADLIEKTMLGLKKGEKQSWFDTFTHAFDTKIEAIAGVLNRMDVTGIRSRTELAERARYEKLLTSSNAAGEGVPQSWRYSFSMTKEERKKQLAKIQKLGSLGVRRTDGILPFFGGETLSEQDALYGRGRNASLPGSTGGIRESSPLAAGNSFMDRYFSKGAVFGSANDPLRAIGEIIDQKKKGGAAGVADDIRLKGPGEVYIEGLINKMGAGADAFYREASSSIGQGLSGIAKDIPDSLLKSMQKRIDTEFSQLAQQASVKGRDIDLENPLAFAEGTLGRTKSIRMASELKSAIAKSIFTDELGKTFENVTGQRTKLENAKQYLDVLYKGNSFFKGGAISADEYAKAVAKVNKEIRDLNESPFSKTVDDLNEEYSRLSGKPVDTLISSLNKKNVDYAGTPLSKPEEDTIRSLYDMNEQMGRRRSLLKDIEGAEQSHRDTLAALNGLYSEGAVSVKQYTDYMNAMPYNAFVIGMQEELNLLGMTNKERFIAQRIAAAEIAAKQQGIEVDRSRITMMAEEIRLLQEQTSVYESITGAVQTATDRLKILDDLIKNSKITLEQYNNEWNKTRLEMLANNTDFVSGVERGFLKMQQSAATFATMGEAAVTKSVDAMSNAFEQLALTGKVNFSSLVSSVLVDLGRLATQRMFSELIGGFGKGAAPGTGIIGAIGGLFSANGNVFQNGRAISAFANGGIVDSPTFFGLRGGVGVAGEAGPEAILPLTRSNGVLGVANHGSSQQGSFTIINSVDPDMMDSYLNSSRGGNVVLNHISRNGQAVRRAIGI